MKELLSAFSYLGIHQAASLVFGLIRTKIIAWLLGPAGMGIFSQASGFWELVRQTSTLGIGNGFLKLIADFRKHRDGSRLARTIMTAVLVFGLLGILLILFSSLFATALSSWIFDDPGYGWFVFIAAVAGLLSAEYFTFLYIYQGMLKWKEYALVSVFGYVFNILLSTVLILWLNILGAILSMLVAQGTNLIIVLFVLRRYVLPQEVHAFWKHLPDRESLAELTRFIGPLSTITLVATLSTLFIRSQVIHKLGLEANGYYQVVYAISLAYMGLIRNAFTAFGLPKVTEMLGEPGKILRVQNDELRLGFLILCPLTLFMMISRHIWVPILYSADFLSAAPILIWQFIADIVRMLRITMNISLIPHNRFHFILFDGLFDWIGWALLSMALIPVMGVAAVPFSYMVTGVISFIIAYVYHRMRTGYRIYRPNQLLLLKGGGLVLAGLFLAQYGRGFLAQLAAPSVLLLIMLLWMPTRDEYLRLLAFAREAAAKIRPRKE